MECISDLTAAPYGVFHPNLPVHKDTGYYCRASIGTVWHGWRRNGAVKTPVVQYDGFTDTSTDYVLVDFNRRVS